MHTKGNKIYMSLGIMRRSQQSPSNFTRNSAAKSILSKRFEYAIQSLPHQTQNHKSSYRDYFSNHLPDPIQSQQASGFFKNQHGSKIINPYSEKAKSILLLKIKSIVNKTLLQAFSTIKKRNVVQSTARKLPTFRQSSSIGNNYEQSDKNSEQENIISTISRKQMRNIELERHISSLQTIQEIQYYKPNVILVNKLLLVQNLNLLQNYGHHWNKSEENQTSKTFSFPNQVSI